MKPKPKEREVRGLPNPYPVLGDLVLLADTERVIDVDRRRHLVLLDPLRGHPRDRPYWPDWWPSSAVRRLAE